MQELRRGLYRWTAAHPEWEPGAEKDSVGDWLRDVGCVAYDAGDVVVLVDPLVDEWQALDELVAGRPVAVVTTMPGHERSRAEVGARYPTAAPRGIEPVEIRGAGETMVWIPEHRALVPGDRLIGDEAGGVRMCPPSWLRYSSIAHDELREALLPLLDLPVDLILVTHGEPVLTDGHAALERALRPIAK